MLDRFALSAGIAILFAGLLGPGVALATVKCQCNNGAIAQAMNADADDDDVDAACDDACSMLGGGRVWSVDTDQDEDGDDDVNRRGERPRTPASPRR
jgi:hypothetical protein